MLRWYRDEGITNGPVFRKKNGKQGKAKDFEFEIFERLERIQRERTNILDPDVDITEEFGLSWSFRRGSDSRALAEGLAQEVIDLNNRWRKFELGKGKRPTFKMFEHYAEIELLLEMLLRYTRAM